MNEKHYPSLEFCKKLTDVGFPVTEKAMVGNKISPIIGMSVADLGKAVACPSVMEMLDVMPKSLNMKYDYWNNEEVEVNFQMWHSCASYYFTDGENHHETIGIVKNTLPNTLAEIILWLVENKHISFNK